MEPKGSSPRQQQPTICLYSQPDEPRSHPQSYFCKIHSLGEIRLSTELPSNFVVQNVEQRM